MTTSNPDFGLDLLSQNDSFNKSLDIDLSVLNDIGVDFLHSLCSKTKQKNVEKNLFQRLKPISQIPVDLSQVPDIKVPC